MLLTRGLHGPVFFGPARSTQARPGPLPFQEDQAQPVSSWARPVAVVAKKKNSFKNNKHRIKHFLPFFAYITFSYITCFLHAFWVLLIISCRPGPSASEPGPARPV